MLVSSPPPSKPRLPRRGFFLPAPTSAGCPRPPGRVSSAAFPPLPR